MNGKVAWNLSVNGEVKRQMQIYCATNNAEISELTEELYRQLLKKKGVRVAEDAETTPRYEMPRKKVRYSKSKPRKK